MTPAQRIHKIRSLRSEISSKKRKHGPVSELRRKLVGLVAQQIRWEEKQEKVLWTTTAPLNASSCN